MLGPAPASFGHLWGEDHVAAMVLTRNGVGGILFLFFLKQLFGDNVVGDAVSFARYYSLLFVIIFFLRILLLHSLYNS